MLYADFQPNAKSVESQKIASHRRHALQLQVNEDFMRVMNYVDDPSALFSPSLVLRVLTKVAFGGKDAPAPASGSSAESGGLTNGFPNPSLPVQPLVPGK